MTGALVVFVATWRIAVPDAPSDEYAYRKCGYLYLKHSQMLCNTAHPPLGKELLGVGLYLFGDTITTARLVTAVAAITTAVFLYLFVRDVGGWGWGLAAGALWGLSPQAGIENGVSLEAIRVDRFALLDPFVACFFAAGLFLGWRWLKQGGVVWPFLAGAACAAAACSKVPGLFVAPVLLGVPVVMRAKGQGRRILAEIGAGIAGCVVIVVAVYAPFGFHLAITQIRDMVHFQSAHAARGTSAVIGHHFYLLAPWWSGLAYATSGLTWPVAVALGACCLVALVSRSGAALFALGASASVWVFLTLATHLSLPYYWIDWEPGVIAAAAIGLRTLSSGRRVRGSLMRVAVVRLALVPAAAATLAFAIGTVLTMGAVATVTIGPYQQAARVITCTPRCLVLYAADGTVLANYLSPHALFQARAAPRGYLIASKDANVMVPKPGQRSAVPVPEYVVVDPASDLATWLIAPSVRNFEYYATALGYVRVPVKGRLEVWRLEAS